MQQVQAHDARDLFVPEDVDQLRARLKETIVQRFRNSPFAADTAHGIHTSWLSDKGLEAPPALVADVLQELVDDGVLRAERVTGGEPLYRRGAQFPQGAPGR
jgi:hypothetical protein